MSQPSEIVQLQNYAKGDGTDETSKIQEAINVSVGKVLYWNKQSGSKYVTNPLYLPSNTHIIFQPGAIVEAAPGYKLWDSMFGAKMVDDIIIEGNSATVRMLKHEYTEGEQRHAFYFLGCKNILIKNLVVKDSGGDAFMAGGWQNDGMLKKSRNIKIENCTLDTHRRQGISLTGHIEDVTIDGCIITNVNGTEPQSGIDIEPNALGEDIRNVTVKNCTLRDNVNGILVYNNSYDIKIVNNRLYNSNSIDVNTFYPDKVSPSVEICENIIVDSSHIGINVVDTAEIKVYDNTIINSANRGIYVGSTVEGTVYNVDIYNNKIANPLSHGISITDCYGLNIFGNRVTGVPSTRNSIYVQQITTPNSTHTNRIYDNTITGGLTGIQLDNSHHSEIRNNLVKSCIGSGIVAASSSHYLIVEDNIIDDCGNSRYPCLQSLDSNYCEIKNNKIRRVTRTPNYGLYVNVNCNTAIIENNDLENSGAVDLFIESTTTVIKTNKWLDGSASPYRVSSLPGASGAWLGTTVIKINNGEDDTLQVCVKNNNGTFAWNTVGINSSYLAKSINYLPETALITNYVNGKITTFRVNGQNPFNGVSGIVTTYRLNGNGWDRQELRKYMSNEVWSRYTDSNGLWTPWVKISAV